MDFELYKYSVKCYSNSELLEQHEVVSETAEMCWDNAADEMGDIRDYWYHEYDECQEQLKILENEMSYRGL